jgi:3-oxoacyl-[acyl-carrier protein] reductase
MAKAFEGKVVLVTGANSGIGEAIAVAFQEAGATVFAIARRQEALENARIRHPGIRWLRADVAKSKDVSAAVASAVSEAGRLDVVVNNAGVFRFAPLDQSTEELVRSQFEANVYGTTFVAQAALPALRASRGTIVNISSAAGHKPIPGGAHYAATKAAVESLTRSWALELAPHGIRVNAVSPSLAMHPFLAKVTSDELLAELKQREAFGRAAEPWEVANVMVFLASDYASYMTGEVVSVSAQHP